MSSITLNTSLTSNNNYLQSQVKSAGKFITNIFDFTLGRPILNRKLNASQ